MNSAYNKEWLYNLAVIKEAKRWMKQSLISADQLNSISAAYPCEFYHPNFLIRILLFVATLLALAGVTGLFALMIGDIGDGGIFTSCILYGLMSFFILEAVFINTNNHYKTGVTEALLYHSCGFTIGGIAGISDGNEHVVFIACIVVFTFAAIRNRTAAIKPCKPGTP